jgi:hypothetical protein
LRLHLTSETLTWDPTTDMYEKQENAIMDYSGNIVCDAAMRGPNLILNELHSLTTDLADLRHDCNFHQVLTAHVVVSSVDSSLSGHVQSRKVAPIDFMTLAGRWMITPDRAKETVQRTTQRSVCTCLNPTLARRFPTNDRMLRYPLVWATKVALAAICLVFPALVFGYKSFNVSMYHVPVPP